MTAKPRLRCAIYTRKSSDEGLDQAFNSLDAQREAGEAYVRSQASEGWRAIATPYDDGGFSGGTMERPALQRLMADLEAGGIDVVVVYKIDRLTRSLADFARIVERFDARGVSFVSVTQPFNTTTSMGRLTLNVLLSFAQFEREVTGERIRDKIAASKARGMWMGGVPPLGYDIPAPGTRVLQVKTEEAAIVRRIFARYLTLGSVHRLADELEREGIVGKRRITSAGKVVGGTPLGRGALFHMLRNPIYLGQIPHKGMVHDGQHAAIIKAEIFERAQALLARHARRHGSESGRSPTGTQLTGRIFDASGHRMSPTQVRGKAGKTYRYYVSAPLVRSAGSSLRESRAALLRISARRLEEVVHIALRRVLPDDHDPLARVTRIEALPRHLIVHIKAQRQALIGPLEPGEELVRDLDVAGTYRLTVPIILARAADTIIAVGSQSVRARRDPVMIAALRRAHAMITRDAGGPNLISAPTSQYGRRLIALALLAPDIQRDILAGCQPVHLTLAKLIASELPIDWAEQRTQLGFSAGAST